MKARYSEPEYCASLPDMRRDVVVTSWLVVCIVVTLLAASSVGAQVAGATSFPSEEGYTIGAGDVLRVVAYQHGEISGEFPVNQDGTITFPYLDQVPVEGMTDAQVATELERLLEKDFYVDVQLQVEVKEHRSRAVTVLGEVGRPGTYYLQGTTTVSQLLAEANGVRSSAGGTLELRRTEEFEDGQIKKVYSMSVAKLLSGAGESDIEVLAGDVLFVPAKQLFFITGEVKSPGRYEIESGMTLMQAISRSGGLDKFAAQKVEIHREVDGIKNATAYDLSEIRKGDVDDPAIRSGDVIIVKRRFF